jgi:heme/copper-type cytochrome/quinol oxidase subunit 1
MSLNNILIGGVYLLLGMFGGFYGFGLSLIIRMEWGLSGYVFVSGNVYNSSISFHGLIMIFFMIMPILIGGFGNILVPIMLGNSDMIFERMNSLSL